MRMSERRGWRSALLIVSTAGICTIAIAPASAQTNSTSGPVIESVPADLELLRKERFRRRTAEAAQKQLERLAEQLREQLIAEVSARKSAEAALKSTLAKIKLAEDIDEERKRLRDSNVQALEKRREDLQRDNLRLSQQLAEEVNRRQQLEAKLEQVLNSGEQSKLAARIEELERALNAAQWARKLAEAQLELVAARLKKASQ